MKYVIHKRFKGKAICGDMNLPATTKCESKDGVITFNGQPLCMVMSENAHQFFAADEDGCGMVRGMLTQAIQKALSKNDAMHQARWDKIWDDVECQPYKRTEYEDYWLWNHSFFNADISVLRHIAKLVGAKEG